MSSTRQCYIYVAAVNLYSVLNQSENLSIYRGTSLKLREATVKLAGSESFKGKLEEISVGASTGLYRSSGQDEQKLCESIRLYLDKNYFGYTFVVVSFAEDEGSYDFSTIKEILIERSRLAQLKQATISFTNYNPHQDQTIHQPVCKFSDLFSADLNEVVSGKKGINRVLKDRFDFGRTQKQNFYKEEIYKAKIKEKVNISEITFTNDIEEISSNPSDEFAAMADKVAYIYLDGNKFSSIQSHVVKDVESQIEFDTAVQSMRADFLNQFIAFAKENKGYFTPKDKLRFETLLWGGDEMLFIIPAWKGFEFINFFLNVSKSWQYKQFPLTHSLGMVFCSHKSSVHTMRNLAVDLAERVKSTRLENEDKGNCQKLQPYLSNKYDFMILESIDYPNESLTSHYKQKYQALGEAKLKYSFNSTSVEQVEHDSLKEQLKLIKKSQVYQLAKKSMQLAKSVKEDIETLPAGSNKSSDKAHYLNELSTIEKRVEAISEGLDLNTLKTLLFCFFFGDSFTKQNEASIEATLLTWVLLAESWDYINCLECPAKGEE